MTDQAVADKLTRARTQLILDHCFFGTLALRLKLAEDPATKTMSVDGKVIRYNPKFVAGLSASLTKAIVAHEVMHCVFDHIGRRADRNPRKWNQAGDHVINLMLEECGFSFEGIGLCDPAYKGMTTDHVYSLLPESEEGDGRDPLDECLDGDTESTEMDATDWKIATAQAAQAAKLQGKLNGALARFVDEFTAPKVDWKSVLRQFITETAKDDYNWMRPNRRFLNQGFILPGMFSETMGEIVVAIDTSGSIDQPTLDAFGSEIKAIVASARPRKTTVIYCDSAVNHVDEFEANDELHFEMHGGGGTDFRPPFAHVDEKGIKPVCFVYLTDGYGPFPELVEYPVLWCCTTEVVAPCGETIRIEV